MFVIFFIEKYIANVYIFQDRVVARYEAETAVVREDASSSQSVDATQIYLDEVGGVKKKRVYGLGSMGSVCLRYQVSSSSINMPSTSQPVQESQTQAQENSRIQALEKEMSVMREQMMQQQREHLQTVQSLTTAFHAQILELIKGLPIPPAITPESNIPSTEGSH